MKNIYWAALHLVPRIGNRTLRRLSDFFGDGETVWAADEKTLAQSKCLTEKMLSELIEFRRSFPLRQLEKEFKHYDVKICVETDENYPAMLKEIFDPPFVLYYRGELKAAEDGIGIVGARSCTPYGMQIAQSIASQLAKAGFTIVSGAAKGIDTNAHIGALKTGRTIAVLGCGLDIAYPQENKQLLLDIAKTGAVISELPLGTPPTPGNFPARNRIITGLSRGVVVVEAAKKSGSLITAELALSEGRDVFAVPGDIYSLKSQGCHKLIQQGAKLVTSAQDIMDEYRSFSVKSVKEAELPSMTAEEKAIYDYLSLTEPKCTDEIIYKLRIDVSNIAFILLQMKIKGLIKETSPNFYIRQQRCVE